LSSQTLPFQIVDANNSVLCDPKDEVPEEVEDDKKKNKKDKTENKQINVNSNTRLNYRWLDLRTETSNAIQRIKTKVTQKFRDFCIENDFIEIHTPKLIPGSSEGGSSVFTFKYFGTEACLAQSPQL